MFEERGSTYTKDAYIKNLYALGFKGFNICARMIYIYNAPMIIQSSTEHAFDSNSQLLLARPDKKFLVSYIEALKEGMSAARHKTQQDEIHNLLSKDVATWDMFEKTSVNGRDADDYCLEDLF
jgi:hypothetical protein